MNTERRLKAPRIRCLGTGAPWGAYPAGAVWNVQLPTAPIESFRQMCLKLFPHAEALYCGVSQSWLVFTENRPGHGRAYWNNAGRGNTESEAWKSLYNSRRV